MKKIGKKGQITLADAPSVVLIVGFVFLIMATIAYVANQFGEAIAINSTDGDTDVAFNVTEDLQLEIADNTSIAGIVLTISLVGIVLSILIGIFISARTRRI